MNTIFRTDGGSTKHWRKLFASDPVDCFTLTHYNELDALQTFLHTYSDHLCAGYVSYELGLALHHITSQHQTDTPLAIFHAYSKWNEDETDGPQSTSQEFQSPINPDLSFKPSVQQNDYEQAIKRIQDYIRAGDFYQINYTQRLHSKTPIPARDLYPILIGRHPSEYACYFEGDEFSIHSLSPELFLHYEDGSLLTEPIKGTRPRKVSAVEDETQKQELLQSEKEQAELFMITDLLRNDLGQVSEIGSVKLDQIKGVKKLPRVWHTSSRISGKLLSTLTPFEALISMLPGGSISGCPKKRALEVIDELENSARGVYTGCIGYFHPDGDFSFNIAIRTLVQSGTQISLGSGGGITIDSNWADEWDELMIKASTFS